MPAVLSRGSGLEGHGRSSAPGCHGALLCLPAALDWSCLGTLSVGCGSGYGEHCRLCRVSNMCLQVVVCKLVELDIGSGRVFVLSHVEGSLRLPQPRLLTWCDRCMPMGPVLYGQHCGAGMAGQVGAGWSAAAVGLAICCWSDNSCCGCFASKEQWFHCVLAGAVEGSAHEEQGSGRVWQPLARRFLPAETPMLRSFHRDLTGPPY